MDDWPELAEPFVVPGELGQAPDGQASRIRRVRGQHLDWSGPLAELADPHRTGVSFRWSQARSLEDLTSPAEMDRAVLIVVNRGIVRNEVAELGTGEANGLVRVVAIYRDPVSGAVQGVTLTDHRSSWYTTEEQLREGWLAPGGGMLHTDQTLSD